jgi:hypothetical protein
MADAFSCAGMLPIGPHMQYVPVDVEFQRISPARLKFALATMLLLVVGFDIAELIQTLG